MPELHSNHVVKSASHQTLNLKKATRDGRKPARVGLIVLIYDDVKWTHRSSGQVIDNSRLYQQPRF